MNTTTTTTIMNTKHTPGPWNSASLNQDSDHLEVFAGIDDGDQVAVVKGYGLASGRYYESIANARLIAAAPLMYERLVKEIGQEETDKLLGY